MKKENNIFLPASIIPEMEKMVNDYHPANKGVIELLLTRFQADPEIAWKMVCSDADFIISGNSYFLMYISAASIDLLLNSFNFDGVKLPLEHPLDFLNSDNTITDKTNTMMMEDISSFDSLLTKILFQA